MRAEIHFVDVEEPQFVECSSYGMSEDGYFIEWLDSEHNLIAISNREEVLHVNLILED